MQMMCSIINSGTKNVGIRLSGSTVIAAIEGPCGSSIPAVVPRLTAVTRSNIPSACQKIKLPRRAGSASFQAANPAVTPMNMSPYPADRAKMFGNKFRAAISTNVNPMILKICAPVIVLGFKDNAKLLNPRDTENQNAKTIIGISAATATLGPNPV